MVWPLRWPPPVSCHDWPGPLCWPWWLSYPIVPQTHRLEFTSGPLHLLFPEVDLHYCAAPALLSSSAFMTHNLRLLMPFSPWSPGP